MNTKRQGPRMSRFGYKSAKRNEVDLKKAISFKDKEIDDLKLKIILRYQKIEAQAGTGPGTDDPQGLGTEPEEDPIIKELRRRIQELEEEVNKLKEQIKSLKKEAEDDRRDSKEMMESLEKRVKDLEDDRCVVLIGELCRRLQENIYRCVLPEKIPINERISYKVAGLIKFIEDNKKMSTKEKKDAKKRTSDIKTNLNWDDWKDLIEDLQGLRNVKSHPPITGELKQEVMDAIEDLNNERLFESMNSSSEEVKKILDMYEKTEKMLK